ncbi:MAG: hypothetical protein K8Q89_02190 [Nitrosarchaeum sp.]|nr:hypothetical protein [Nitrosarchaeum sp.]
MEYLQDNNATTKTNIETYGKTLTDLAESGLNKTRVHKHLPELKTQQLIISRQISTGGRPAEKYGITPLGSLKVFKHRLEGKTFHEECIELEKIQTQFPLITQYWNSDLDEFRSLRYKALFNAINRLETRIRGKHYFSIAMALQHNDRFLTFEKTYVLVTTPKDQKITENGIILEIEDPLYDFGEASQTKIVTVDKIEKDIENFVTFQFYYYLMMIPKSINALIDETTKIVKKNPELKDIYHEKLLRYTLDYRESLNLYFDSDPKKIELEMRNTSERLQGIVKSIIHKNKVLRRMIPQQQNAIRNTSDSILNYL